MKKKFKCSKYNRNLYSPIDYKKFKKRILRRDNYVCQFPYCNHLDKHLELHHIRRWADHPLLRFVEYNGIILCQTHHKLVTGREQKYEGIFYNIIARKNGQGPINKQRKPQGRKKRYAKKRYYRR